MAEGCWLKKGWCPICGASEHRRDSCPKVFVKRSEDIPECPNCGGEHWGKDCIQTMDSDTSLN